MHWNLHPFLLQLSLKVTVEDYTFCSNHFLWGGCQSVPRCQVFHGPQENQLGRWHAGLGAWALRDPPAAGLHFIPPALTPPGTAIQHHGRAVSVPLLSPWSGRAPCWVGSLLKVSDMSQEKHLRSRYWSFSFMCLVLCWPIPCSLMHHIQFHFTHLLLSLFLLSLFFYREFYSLPYDWAFCKKKKKIFLCAHMCLCLTGLT